MGANSLPTTVTRQRRNYDWNPGCMLTTRLLTLKCYNLRVLTINISTKNGVINVINAKRAYRRCLVVLPLCRSKRRMTRLSVWDTFTTRLFHDKVHKNVDITSSFTNYRIRQRTRQQKNLLFDFGLIFLAMLLCMGLFLSVCLSVWLLPAQELYSLKFDQGRHMNSKTAGPILRNISGCTIFRGSPLRSRILRSRAPWIQPGGAL